MPKASKSSERKKRQSKRRTVANVERKLWAVALYSASDYGFAQNCEARMKDVIRRGAKRIEKDGFLNDNVRVALAEANMVAYVSEMIFEARRRGYSELHENTENKASIKLCPLWPFC
jgi:hypothetical protein